MSKFLVSYLINQQQIMRMIHRHPSALQAESPFEKSQHCPASGRVRGGPYILNSTSTLREICLEYVVRSSQSSAQAAGSNQTATAASATQSRHRLSPML